MKKIVSFILSLALLLSALPLTAFAFEDANGIDGGVTLDKEDAYPAIREAFAEHLVNTVHIEKDDYLGIPVDLYVYAKVGRSSEIAPVLLYVINTNTERVGTESDVSILTDLIEEYIVVVVDYRNNSLTTPVNVDQSVHRIHYQTAAGTHLSYEEDGVKKSLNIIKQADNWVLPAGYRIMRDITYFNFKLNGVEGTLERIVQVWNEDFSDTTYAGVKISWGQKTTEDGTLVFNDTNGERCYKNDTGDGYVYADGSAVSGTVVPEYKKLREGASYADAANRIAYVRDTLAEDWWDCVKKDGTPVDLNLYLDILYPSEPKDGAEIPVLAMAVSRQSTTGNWFAASDNPEYIGAALFSGYAGLLYEYAYVPMARKDHYGYFTDSKNYPDTTNTDWKYGLSRWVGMRASRAAIRTFRYYCDTLDSLDTVMADNIGLICISKTGYNLFLGNEHPEDIPETNKFSETQDESQPQPYLTYDDGTQIPCGVQAMYTVSGGSPYNMAPGYCPVYVSVGMQDSGAYAGFYKQVRLNALSLDLESVHYSLPRLGHAYLVGMCEEYNVDTYQSVMDFFDYHVAGKKAAVEYITPLSGSTNVGTTETVTVKFNASVSLSTVKEKVQIVNAKTGARASGTWESLYGNTEWRFHPDGLDGAATYLVYVPEDTLTEDGRPMKASKTAAFVTVAENLAMSGTYASGDGQNTVVRGNDVYILFDTPDVSASTSEVLRFHITNEHAAQTLSVYALASIDGENIENSVRGEKIGEIVIAGSGAYEMDISDYLAGVGDEERIGFVLVAEREDGVTVLHNETYDSASSTSTLKPNSTSSVKIVWSDAYSRDGEGGSMQITKTGSSYYFDNSLGFGNNNTSGKLTAADYGRLFRVRMSVYVPETARTTQYLRVSIGYRNPYSTGTEQYVDWEDITFNQFAFYHYAGQWVDIDFYYLIDDLYYTNEEIQKCLIAVTQSNEGVLYIDNYRVEEIVTPIALSATAAPSIITHSSVKADTSLLEQILLGSGSYGDIYFGDSEDMIVRGETVSMTKYGAKKVYLKLDLSSVSLSTPTTITMNVLSTTGGIVAFYGITDAALGASWSKDTISWQNAPANDRFGTGVDSDATVLLQKIAFDRAGPLTLDVWDFCTEMRDKGAEIATVIAVLETAPGDVILSEDFEDGELTGFGASPSGGTPYYGISDELAYPDGGKYAFKVIANSVHSRILFKIGENLTVDDEGEFFVVKYDMYSVDGGTFKQCMRPTTSELQGETVKIEAGVWTEMSYTYQITEQMLKYPATFAIVTTKLGALTSSEGPATSTFYIDNLRVCTTAGDIVMEIAPEEEENSYILNADFDKTTVPFALSGGLVTGDCRVVETELAYSGTKAFEWVAKDKNHRPMLELFPLNTLTADMIGRQYEISYMFLATRAGSFSTYPRMVANGKATEFKDAITQVSVTYSTASTWQRVTATITITEGMVNLTSASSLRIAILSSGFNASTSNPVTCYVDDLTLRDLTPEEAPEQREPYFYKQDFTSQSYAVGSGFEYTQHGSSIFLVDEGDRKTGGDGALKVLANRNYNRILFRNIIDNLGFNTSTMESWAEGATNGLTSADIGRTFRVSFYIKSDTVGKLAVLIADHKANKPCTTEKSYSINTVDEWTKIVYEFEINQKMIDNRQACLVIKLSSFDYASNGTTLRTLWIDDLTSVEVVEGYGETVTVSDAATISNTAALKNGALEIDRDAQDGILAEGIRAVVLRFSPEMYRTTTAAKLSLAFREATGHRVNVYGLTFTPEANATFNSLMALNADGKINSKAVFGGAPLATFTVEGLSALVDIREYAASRDGEELVFLITTEDSSTVDVLYADFTASLPAIGTDVSADTPLKVEDGALTVSSDSVSFHNLISYKNTPLLKGYTYTFRLKASADADKKFALYSGETLLCANKTLQNGELVFEFVAGDGIQSLTLVAESAGFSIHSYSLTQSADDTTLSEADTEIYLADCASNLSAIPGAKVGMTLTENATLTVYIPVEFVKELSQIRLGETNVDLSALVAEDGYYLLSIRDIPIKNLALTHTLTLTYKSGLVRRLDINTMEYLASLLEGEYDLKLKQLVYELIAYARAAEVYFYGQSKANLYILCDMLLTEYAQYCSDNGEIAPAVRSGNLSDAIATASIRLGDAPSVYFRAKENFTGTVTLTDGTVTVSYEVVNGKCGGENILLFAPTGAYAAANVIHITVSGSVNAEGDYSIGTYREAASRKGMTDVVAVVDALYTYIHAARVYMSH